MNKKDTLELLVPLSIFEEVATQLSFSMAAEAFMMTPSAISKNITKLENTLGVKLLERSTRKIKLTATGEKLLAHSRNILHEASTVVDIAEDVQQKLTGNISIAAPKAFAHKTLQPIIMSFLYKFPDMSVKVIATDETIDLLRHEADCIIEITNTPSDYLVAKPLTVVKQVVCATPRYLQSDGDGISAIKTPQDLINHSCLTLGEHESDNQWEFWKGQEKSIVRVKGRYSINHSSMRLDAILHDLGIGCLPEFVAEEALRAGDIVQILPEWQLQSKYQGTVWVSYLPNKYQRLAFQAFIQHITDALSNV